MEEAKSNVQQEQTEVPLVGDELSTWTALKVVIVEYFLSTTAHALPNIFRTSNILIKIIWLLCFLACTAYCMKSMIVSLQEFLEYPSYISTTIVKDMPSKFPAVTICNLKSLNKNASYAYFSSMFGTAVDNYSAFDSPLEYVMSHQFVYRSVLNSDSTLTADDRKNLGYKLDDMLLSCSFNYKTCKSSDFTYHYDPLFGNCYTFNKGLDNNGTSVKVKKNTIEGVYYGLQLELFLGGPLETETYNEYSDGLLVSIHNQSSQPFKKSLITASTGTQTSMAITRHFTTKLEKPHGDCLKNVDKTTDFKSTLFDYIVRELDIEYTQNYCSSLCIQRQILKECNCSNLYLPPLSKMLSNFCITEANSKCMMSVIESFDEKLDVLIQCQIECPFECETVDYETEVSTASFPTRYYRELLYNKSSFIQASGIPLEDVGQAMTKVSIFYKSMEYKLTEQKKKTSTEDFFSNIGGTLGLYIGISILSVVELIELVINLTIALLTVRKKQNKVKNTPAI